MDDLAVQNPLSHIAEVETGVSVGFSIPGRVSVSGRNSTSGSIFVPRPSRACDLVTMVEAGPAPGRVTTGVGSVSRGRWDETQIARQIAATYVTVAIGFHVNYRQIHQTSTY